MSAAAPAALLVLLAAPPRAAASELASGAEVLRLTVSARAAALAGATSAHDDALGALHGNPALLGPAPRPRLGTFHRQGLADAALDGVAAASPLPKGWAAGASLLWSRLGRVETPTTNPDGSFAGETSLPAGSDLLASVGAAYRLPRLTLGYFEKEVLPEAPDHYVGATARLLRSTLAQAYTAQAAVFDVGYVLAALDGGPRLALLVQNLGSGVRYRRRSEPLPLAYRVGASWPRPLRGAPALMAEAYLERGRGATGRAGLEWELGAVTGRLGYEAGKEARRWSTGLGLGLPAPWGGKRAPRLRLDYAIAPAEGLGYVHLLGLSCELGN